MVNNAFNLPLWGPGQFNVTGTSFVDFELSPPLTKRPSHLDRTLLLERADELLSKKQWKEALTVLTDIQDEAFARPLLMTALKELGDDSETIKLLWPPSTNEEIVMVGAAILSVQERNRAKAFLQLGRVSNNTDASVTDIKRRISMRWSK
jgi:hypothetical protein